MLLFKPPRTSRLDPIDMETFERDAPLFDRRFHVLVQYADRDEKLLPLTLRLLNGVRVRLPRSCDRLRASRPPLLTSRL